MEILPLRVLWNFISHVCHAMSCIKVEPLCVEVIIFVNVGGGVIFAPDSTTLYTTCCCVLEIDLLEIVSYCNHFSPVSPKNVLNTTVNYIYTPFDNFKISCCFSFIKHKFCFAVHIPVCHKIIVCRNLDLQNFWSVYFWQACHVIQMWSALIRVTR